MANTNPTPSQILKALRDAGITNLRTYDKWDTIGRPWQGPDGSPGLTGMVIHHTATASATGSTGTPSLWWAVNAYELPVCNLLVGRDEAWLLSAGSAYHCGDGGPVKHLGIPSRGYLGQTRLFGIEIDDAGVRTDSLTAYQVDTVAKTIAALSALTGFNIDKAVGTHKCYTDGCHGWNPAGPSPCLGRKNDTIDGPWGSFPGDPTPQPYNAPWWREKGKQALQPAPMWDGTVPAFAAVKKAEADRTVASRAAYRVACRLHDLGHLDVVARKGKQTYPAAAVSTFRVAQGWAASEGYSARVEKRLFHKNTGG